MTATRRSRPYRLGKKRRGATFQAGHGSSALSTLAQTPEPARRVGLLARERAPSSTAR